MARLKLDRVGKRFGPASALEDVSFEVDDGELLVLVGPSGCGKSTLLRIIAGLVPAGTGEILLDGRRVNELEPRERDVAMVFQNYALYPHMSVAQNLAFPLELARVPRAQIRERVRETAEALGLTPLLARKPGTLSGGQMQRVALGRAIIRKPRLFLFDEPLSNLDAKLRGELRTEIARLHQRLSITTLYVTHDQAEAMTLGSRIAVLEGGRLVQIGPPLEVFGRPASTFVATFIGSPAMNLVPGAARAGRFRFGGSSLPCPVADQERIVLGMRPHEIELASDRSGFAASVCLVESLGTQTLVRCELEGLEFVLAREGQADLRAGQELSLVFPERARHWFDGESGRRVAGT